jgi:hypothetical protein
MRNKMRNLQATPTLSKNTINHYSSTKKNIAKNNYRIELVTPASPIRNKVEKFIQTSYKNHFSAQLNIFFPLILTVINIDDDSIMGALGLRYADEEVLFSESYLPDTVENSIFAHEQGILNRSKIIELGNFVVESKADIKFVLPAFSQFIKSLDVDWVIYTLTRPIKSYFNKFGIELNFLHDAKAEAVNGAATDWGKYYQFNPAVYYSSVQKSMNY